MDLIRLEGFLDNTSFLILFATLLAYWIGAAFPQPWLAQLGSLGMASANLVMAALLGARWLEAGYFPISNLYESLFFLAWGLTTAHLIAEAMSQSRLVGVCTAPVALGITAFAALTLPTDMQVSAPLVPALKSNWLMMHVSVMMISYAALMVGSLLAIAFLVVTKGQTVTLRGSSVGTGSYRLQRHESMPSQIPAERGGSVAVLTRPETLALSPERLSLADTLDNISYRIIGLGFPLLTIGIIAGAVWANEAWGSYWSWDPKETWALITWLVFAAYLHARITKGWQGRRPALLAAGGFLVVWVCYLGVNLLGKGLHSYGWFF
jgi:cytochrome c-type biogenesis protein CcsB